MHSVVQKIIIQANFQDKAITNNWYNKYPVLRQNYFIRKIISKITIIKE